MALLHRHRRQLFFLGRFSYFPNFPWVLPLVWIAAYIQITLLSDNTVSIYPIGSLLLDLSLALITTLLMMNDLSLAPHPYTLFTLLTAPHLYPLIFLLAAHPSKNTRIYNTVVPHWYHQKDKTTAGSCIVGITVYTEIMQPCNHGNLPPI